MAQKKDKKKKGPTLTPKGTQPKKSLKAKKMANKREKKLAAIANPSATAAAAVTTDKPRKRLLSANASDTPKAKRASKRVSFPLPNQLVQAKAIHEIDSSMAEGMESATSTPSRSILKKKEAAAKKPQAKEESLSKRKAEAGPEDRATLNETLPSFADGASAKKRRGGLLVKKEDKEALATMSRGERKVFLKTLKAKRKVYYDVAIQAKQLWEKIRSRKTEKEAKEKLIEQLRALIKGKVRMLMMAHDTVRVVQCLCSLNRKEILDDLWEEISVKSTLILAAKSKYAHFLLLKLLRNGSKEQRDGIMRALTGKIPDLATNNYAAEVIELAYNDFAVAAQRRRIAFEFYGPEFRLFQTETNAKNLTELLAVQPSKKAAILDALKEHLIAISSKAALRHSLSHRLLAEFFTFAEAEARDEVIEAIKERVVEIVHTRDGALAALYVVWFSSAKDRKLLLKSLKDLVLKTAKEEHGHLFLIALLDIVDDTVALNKIIVKELVQRLDSLVRDPNNSNWGKRVLHYILHPRHASFFPKELQAILAKGDSNPFSKKDPAQRHRELLSALAAPLLHYLGANMDALVWDANNSLFVTKALQATMPEEDLAADTAEAVNAGRRRCFEALTEIAAREFVPCDIENRLHLVEHKNGNFLLGILLKLDASLVLGGAAGLDTLSGSLAAGLSGEQLSSFTACNKGGFVLLRMFESGEAAAATAVRAAVGRELKKLKSYSFPSAKLLLEVVVQGKAPKTKPLPKAHCLSFPVTA